MRSGLSTDYPVMLERVPVGLRGELTRWMIEPRAGVFVGVMSGLVRDKLWEKVREKAGGGAAVLIHSARTEQGFQVRTWGDPSRHPIDIEGLTLVRIPARAGRTGARSRKKGVEESECEEESSNEAAE